MRAFQNVYIKSTSWLPTVLIFWAQNFKSIDQLQMWFPSDSVFIQISHASIKAASVHHLSRQLTNSGSRVMGLVSKLLAFILIHQLLVSAVLSDGSIHSHHLPHELRSLPLRARRRSPPPPPRVNAPVHFQSPPPPRPMSPPPPPPPPPQPLPPPPPCS
ncbi:hypothetical protein ACJRO7_032713 [Eucalyptus globulus]|uniref:Uncharacterized protein n=1 Tax=Eucalyptus globulus TaxID=34317 RepID=A0ABD3JNY1_EUCGL